MEKPTSPPACLFALLVVVSLLGACSSTGASPPAADCSTVVLSLADCLSFVEEGGSAPSRPQGSCCSSLKKVVKTDVGCLCDGFRTSASLGVKLNMTRAVALPAACGLSSSALAVCNFSGVSGGAHAPSPASRFFANVPVGSPSGAGVAVGSPAPAPMHAEAATIKVMPTTLLFVGAIAALYF